MGQRYEKKRNEVRDNLKEASRIKTDRGVLKKKFSILSALDSFMNELEDETRYAVKSVEAVGELERSRLECESKTNEVEKNKLSNAIEDEISKLQKGMATLNEMGSSMFGKHSIEQAKRKYSQQTADYVKLLKELDKATGELLNVQSERFAKTESKETDFISSEISEPLLHGVSQMQIDSLRGIRDHQTGRSVTPNDIKKDYLRVGISITDEQADEIFSSINLFSTDSGCKGMREARFNENEGKKLTPIEQKYLAQYKLCEEYCKIAPTFSSTTVPVVFRGIHKSSKHKHFENLLSLRPGDLWDMDKMPTSFSSDYAWAKMFAGSHGIIIHTASKNLKNSTSIKGISEYSYENEILVADYNWIVSSIDDQRDNGDGFYHITLEVK